MKSAKLTVQINATIVKEIRELSKTEGSSISEIMNLALRDYLKKVKPGKKFLKTMAAVIGENEKLLLRLK